jgi:hypothetical protein
MQDNVAPPATPAMAEHGLAPCYTKGSRNPRLREHEPAARALAPCQPSTCAPKWKRRRHRTVGPRYRTEAPDSSCARAERGCVLRLSRTLKSSVYSLGTTMIARSVSSRASQKLITQPLNHGRWNVAGNLRGFNFRPNNPRGHCREPEAADQEAEFFRDSPSLKAPTGRYHLRQHSGLSASLFHTPEGRRLLYDRLGIRELQ